MYVCVCVFVYVCMYVTIFSTKAIFLYSALFNCFTRSRSMTVTIGTQKLRSCPMHLKLLNKLKVTEKALSCRNVAEQLADRAAQ